MRKFFKKFVVSILTFEARTVIAKRKPFVIEVTGSVGKTSAKDAIFAVLRDDHGDKKTLSIRKSEKSFNSEIGVPLTVLGLQNGWYNPFVWGWNIIKGFLLIVFPYPYPQTLVLEIGADHPGDIAKTTTWMKPDIALVTRIPDRPVHIEYFSGPEEVKKEKSELVRALSEHGVFVANADDPEVLSLAGLTRARMLTYGFSEGAQVRGSYPKVVYEVDDDVRVPIGMNFRVDWQGNSFPVTLGCVLGIQPCMAALAALAVGTACGSGMVEMIAALAELELPRGRMRIIPGKGATTIIDDSYNSSPVAVEAALETLRILDGKHKIAILGDMLELGAYSEEEHWKVGRYAGAFVDTLVVVGSRARTIAEAAKTSGLPQAKIQSFEDSVSAGEWVALNMEPGDIILVKGSQGSGANMIRMERAVKAIMAHPEQAPELLVRQEHEWQLQYT